MLLDGITLIIIVVGFIWVGAAAMTRGDDH